MRAFVIAGVQMNVVHGADNIPRMRAKLDALMARFPWVEMVVFSELAAFGASKVCAQTLPGPAEEAFQEMASRHSLWLIPGSLFEKSADRIYNTTSVIGPSGAIVGRYRKMFPFRPYETAVAGGTEFLTFDVPDVGRFGVSICYDMWFPETTRTLASMGAEVILHPVMTPTIDRDVELSIARATAATNQIYVVDVNGVGAGGVGRSLVVGPDGDVLHQAGQAEELVPLELDLSRVARSRERGLHGLGQLLKSFRDAPVEFEVYRRDSTLRTYLSTLGPLVKPGRRSHATPHPDHEER
jgi:predicted amidohydrolase